MEWGTYGIRVNGVAPGPIEDTPGFTKLVGGQQQALIDQLKERVPLGRAGTTEEIGDSCVFLCSTAARYVSGHTLVVDGGSWLWTIPTAPRAQVAQIAKSVEAKSRAVGGAKI